RRVGRLDARRQGESEARAPWYAGPIDAEPQHAEREGLDAVELLLPRRHLLADVVLGPLRQFLKRTARCPPASGARRDAGRKRAESQRLQQLAGGVHLLTPLAAWPRCERHADGVSDPFLK